ncbi:MAG: DTW domain-containing protein [Myxococcales bacterium]|nr:DTW domain-containing protein [Myxococcales bacterium]
MRSFTTAELPGRCRRCWIRLEHCICALLPVVRPRTGVVVVRHAREANKSTGTVRVAALALPEARVLEYGEDTQPAQAQLGPLLLPGTHLLFPSEESAPWDGAQVQRLVVLDGTWRQARRMFHRLPALHALPRLALPAKEEAVLRLRESPHGEGRSTLEAIADALLLLEGDAVAAPLHRLHTGFVEAVFKARGVWEQKRAAAAPEEVG